MINNRKFFAFVICSALLISALTGCNIHEINAQPTSSYETSVQMTTAVQIEQTDILPTEAESTTPNTALFEDVYNEYAEALISKTPVLISDFTAEAGAFTENDFAKALLEEKKNELSDIFNEGLAMMVMVVGDTGADNEEYEFWHNKLNAVYNAQIEELLNSCASQNDIEFGEDIDY